ncbi:MAG TPA: biotin/lipoyl-containing protein [Rhizomicrobium sp.]|nr:biotin/lipoyl-containing protein [Rhizomicrobium sp.]
MAGYLLKPAGAGEPTTVTVEREASPGAFTIRIGDRSFRVHHEADAQDRGFLNIDGRSLPYFVYRKDDTLQIWIDGAVHVVDVVDRTAQRATSRSTAAQRDDLPAPMPGTILAINVKPNDQFESHAPLVVMESMKMEMTLSAPHAGRVKEVKCKPGQLVDMGAVLITFASKNDAAAS